MKVGMLYLPRLSVGGVESRILSLVNHTDQNDNEWVIIAPVSEEFKSKLPPKVSILAEWDLNHIWHFNTWIKLKETILSEKIDILHIHSPSAAIPGRVAAWFAHKPVIYTVHLPAHSFFSSRSSLKNSLRKIFYATIDCFLNHTLTSRMLFVSWREYHYAISKKLAPKNRSNVIENGIDLELFSERSTPAITGLRENIHPNTVLIIFVGRLEYQKGIDTLLEAISQMQSDREDFAFWIVGDGSLREELIAKARELGLQDMLHFLGAKTNIPQLLSVSDIFVLPSRFETMPFSVLEALAAGLPCIVTDVGDNPRMVINNENGLVTPPEDKQALAQALDDLIAHPDKRKKMGTASIRRVAQFSNDSMVHRILALYREVCDGS